MFQNKVIIALGTNIGNWKNNFNQALIELNKIGFISNFGSIYYSKPFGFKNQSFFYNTAIEFITLANPIKLLKDRTDILHFIIPFDFLRFPAGFLSVSSEFLSISQNS